MLYLLFSTSQAGMLVVKKDHQRAIDLARSARDELLLQRNQPGGRPALADATAWLDELTGGKL